MKTRRLGRSSLPVGAIPGTKRRRFLEENLAAEAITFTAAELASIDAIAPPGAAAGLRYPAATMASVAR